MPEGTTEYLTAKEAAEVLRVNTWTVYRLIKRGELPARHVGRSIRVLASAVRPEPKGTAA